jgi:hypothetical protein
MRIVLAIALVCSMASYGGGEEPLSGCGDQRHGSLTDAYYRTVLERALRPPDWQTALITISVSVVGSETEFIVREQGGKFELLRGAPQDDIHAFLTALEASCDLPANPTETADRIKVMWDRKQLSATAFDKLHHEFTSALLRYVSEIQAQYQGLLTKRSALINLHVPEYCIIYDNKSKHIEIRADDVASRSGKREPIVRWARAIMLNKESF